MATSLAADEPLLTSLMRDTKQDWDGETWSTISDFAHQECRLLLDFPEANEGWSAFVKSQRCHATTLVSQMLSDAQKV